MVENTAPMLRPAMSGDDRARRSLAERDSASPLHGPILVALAGDDLVAALSPAGGRALADRFRPAAGVLAVLRDYAQRSAGRRRERRRLARPPRFRHDGE